MLDEKYMFQTVDFYSEEKNIIIEIDEPYYYLNGIHTPRKILKNYILTLNKEITKSKLILISYFEWDALKNDSDRIIFLKKLFD